MCKKLLGLVAAAAVFLGMRGRLPAAVQKYEKDAIAYDETVLFRDAETRRRFLDEIESSFLEDYDALWQREGMSARLTAAADRVFADSLSGGRLTGSLQVAMDLNGVVQRIQDKIPEAFRGDYERFLAIVEDSFTDAYLDRLSAYDQALLTSRVGALVNAPSVRIFFEEQVRRAAAQSRAVLGESLTKEIRGRPELSLAGSAAFLGMMLGRKLLRRTLGRKALSVFGKGLGRKVLMAATGVGALLTVGWALYDVGSFAVDVWESPARLRETLLVRYDGYYRTEAPRIYWQTLRKGVRSELDEIQGRMARRDEDTKAILASSTFRRMTERMSEAEQKNFIDRLISVRPLDGSLSYSSIVENFGRVLVESEAEDIAAFREILAQGDTLLARQWFAVAGKEYFSLFRNLPRLVWDKYFPDAASLQTLRWLALRPRTVREAAAQLPADSVQWLMSEVPPAQAERFFADGKTPGEIAREIERMKSLPKAARIPWQSGAAYLLHRAENYALFAGIALALLAAAWLYKKYLR